MFCLHVFVFVPSACITRRVQKRAMDSLKLESQTVLNSLVDWGESSKESLEGQLVLFTAEESLQPHVTSLKQHSLNVYSVPATFLHVQCLKS